MNPAAFESGMMLRGNHPSQLNAKQFERRTDLDLAQYLDQQQERTKQEAAAGKSAEYFFKANPDALKQLNLDEPSLKNMSSADKYTAMVSYGKAQMEQEAQKKRQMDEQTRSVFQDAMARRMNSPLGGQRPDADPMAAAREAIIETAQRTGNPDLLRGLRDVEGGGALDQYKSETERMRAEAYRMQVEQMGQGGVDGRPVPLEKPTVRITTKDAAGNSITSSLTESQFQERKARQNAPRIKLLMTEQDHGVVTLHQPRRAPDVLPVQINLLRVIARENAPRATPPAVAAPGVRHENSIIRLRTGIAEPRIGAGIGGIAQPGRHRAARRGGRENIKRRRAVPRKPHQTRIRNRFRTQRGRYFRGAQGEHIGFARDQQRISHAIAPHPAQIGIDFARRDQVCLPQPPFLNGHPMPRPRLALVKAAIRGRGYHARLERVRRTAIIHAQKRRVAIRQKLHRPIHSNFRLQTLDFRL